MDEPYCPWRWNDLVERKSSGPRVLVTGGAGYIGSHTVRALLEEGYNVVVFDDLSRGHPESIPGTPLVIGELSDPRALKDLFTHTKFDAVIHFAGESLVGESVRNPDKYFQRNVVGGLSLLSAMQRAGVKKIVFSSSAGVYGEPEEIPIPEEAPLRPSSPYGETKVMMEHALSWYDRAYGMKHMSLRYFNAAGADASGQIGEDHEPETHLIPLVIEAALRGQPITIFGDDYPTPDGTCIRDYVHVTDLAHAHVLALAALFGGSESHALNIGSGRGYSNMEIVRAVSRIAGRETPHVMGPRRDGDPAILVARTEKAREILGFVTQHSSLEHIVETAWRWHTREDR